MKFIKKSLSVLLALTIVLNLVPNSVSAIDTLNNVGTYAITSGEVDNIISDISSSSEFKNVSNDEWKVIELVALGKQNQIDKEAFIKYVQSQLSVPDRGYHDNVKGMEKAAIALTLLGIDATKFTLTDGSVFNMIDAIANVPANSFGEQHLIDIAGEAFALSAYDSGSYELNTTDYFTREKVIGEILKRQKSNGNMGSVDFTAMAITSLSEYYTINPDVKITIDKAIDWLSSVQEADGSFNAYGSNSNSTSMAIVALSSLGIDAGSDLRFIKNGNSAIDGLMKFKLADNTFGFQDNQKYNGLATEQALRALITYREVLNTKKPYNIYETMQARAHIDDVTINKSISDITATYQNISDDQWKIIELAALGNVSNIDRQGFITFLQGKLAVPGKGYYNDVKALEKSAIALSALGINATKFTLADGTNFDFIKTIANYSYNGKYTLSDIYGEIFALSAYDSGSYAVDAPNHFTRDTIVTSVLSQQKANGSFGGFDATGMVVASLSEYYNTKPEVKVALDKAVTYMSTAQGPDGDYGVNSNSTAMIVVALSSLGIDANTDVRFIKNGNSAINGLYKYKSDNNPSFGFKDKAPNGLATEQVYRALISYSKLKGTGGAYNIYKFPAIVTNPPSGGGSGGGTITPPTDIRVSVKINGDTRNILGTTNVTVAPGSSAWMAMQKVMDSNNISYSNASGNYISSIAGLSEFDNGPNSGWFYYVNSVRPTVGVADYRLSNGDTIRLSYTNDGKTDAFKDSSGGSSGGSTGGSTDEATKPTDKPDIEKEPEVIATPKFEDIKGFEWAEKEINILVKKGIIKGTGDGSFGPEKLIKRADFVVMLSRALELDKKPTANFKDVSKDKYYYNEIGIFKELGIINGSGDNFNPEGEITREDMFVITQRALEKTNKLTVVEKDTNTKFTDNTQVSSYAVDAIDKLASMGLVKGSDGKINPKNNATRAETAVFISRIIEE